MKIYATRGFTLLELLIVLVILSGLTLMTAQSINKAIRAKKKFEGEIEQTSVMRDALRIIERDINMAFHYRNIHYEVLKKIKEATAQSPTLQPPNQPTTTSSPIPSLTPPTQNAAPLFQLKDPPPNDTQFLGENDSLYFTTLSHVRTQTNAVESDQAEVGYFVKNCRRRGLSPKKAGTTTSCLWRKESLFIDNDLQRGGREVPILEDVEKFELLYFGEEKEGWQKSWRTDEKGPEDIRGRFPQAVQIKLTTHDKNPDSKKKYSMVMVAALRFPNNPPQNKSITKGQPNDKAILPTDSR